jgi:ABC-type multidrug transport system permease subunit
MPPINPSQDLYFPSKQDWWIVALIWFGVLASLAGGIVPLIVMGASWTEMILVGSLLLGMDSLMLWVLYGTGYTRVHFSDEESLVQPRLFFGSIKDCVWPFSTEYHDFS